MKYCDRMASLVLINVTTVTTTNMIVPVSLIESIDESRFQ